jgi:hypothetical protein
MARRKSLALALRKTRHNSMTSLKKNYRPGNLEMAKLTSQDLSLLTKRLLEDLEKGSKKDWTILMIMGTSRKGTTRDTPRIVERNSFILVQVLRLSPRMKKSRFALLASNLLSKESSISPKQVLS